MTSVLSEFRRSTVEVIRDRLSGPGAGLDLSQASAWEHIWSQAKTATSCFQVGQRRCRSTASSL